MDDHKIISLWQTSNEQLQQSFSMISRQADEISRLKIQSLLHSMRPIKIFALIIGVIWVVAGVFLLSRIFIYAFDEANKFFLFSASIQIFLSAIAVMIYLYQMFTISQVRMDDPILKTQKRLTRLKITTLWVTRILLLQLPVWTTFWWSDIIFQEWCVLQLGLSLCITGLFTYAALWMFFNIKYENRNKKWFQLLFSGTEWTPLMKSMELLGQIDDYSEGEE